MNQSRHSFVTSNEILSDVVRIVQDQDYRINSKGYYNSLIQQAIEELAFDTYFDERSEIFDIPENGRIELPRGAFNIKQMYAFDGDRCDVGKTENIYFKRNFIRGGSSGFFSRNKGNNSGDPFYPSDTFVNRGSSDGPIGARNGVNGSLYYGIQDGIVMLSDAVLRRQKVMIVYNGVGGDIGEVPFIPTFLRQAVKDWVSSRGLDVRISQSVGTPEFTSWQSIKAGIDFRLNQDFDGSWAKAEYRVKKLDSKHREDYKEYMSKMDLA